MGKKKIALVDLSQSETPRLKATVVRSQKLNLKKKDQPQEDMGTPIAKAQVESAKVKKEEKPATKIRKRIKHAHSKRYQAAKKLIDQKKAYAVDKAVKLLKETSTVKFDASVELHGNLSLEKIAGEMTLPHGTGKTLKVEIASDKTLTKLNAGTIDFDVLVAEPTMMPKLAKFAKLLGPKGLMPNPKTGTISADPQATAKKLAGGAVRFKSENKAPLIHLVVGKLSFKEEALTANVTAAIKAIQPKNLTSLYLTASMSPSIKLSLA